MNEQIVNSEIPLTAGEYEAFRRKSLWPGMWFVSPIPSGSSGPKVFHGWTIPPFAELRSFRILIDGQEIPTSSETVSPDTNLFHMFVRCGIEAPAGLIFSFRFQPSKTFPDQHEVHIVFDGAEDSKLLPVFLSSCGSVTLPPSSNTYRTNHINESEVFLHTGQCDAGRLIWLFQKHRTRRFDPTILDWGCGCARVSQFLSRKYGINKVFGADIDPVNIGWCQSNISKKQYISLNMLPNLPFSENKFDLIYGISVMTHLSEDHQKQWLRELRRVAAKEAIIMLTFHGLPQFFTGVNNGLALRKLLATGFLDHGRSSDLDDGFSESKKMGYYRNVFNSPEHVQHLFSSGFEIIDYYPGSMLTQDLIIARKR